MKIELINEARQDGEVIPAGTVLVVGEDLPRSRAQRWIALGFARIVNEGGSLDVEIDPKASKADLQGLARSMGLPEEEYEGFSKKELLEYLKGQAEPGNGEAEPEGDSGEEEAQDGGEAS